MKKLLVALCMFMFMGTGAVVAQETQPDQEEFEQTMPQDTTQQDTTDMSQDKWKDKEHKKEKKDKYHKKDKDKKSKEGSMGQDTTEFPTEQYPNDPQYEQGVPDTETSDDTMMQDQGMESDTTSQEGIGTYPQDEGIESDTTSQDATIQTYPQDQESDTTSQDKGTKFPHDQEYNNDEQDTSTDDSTFGQEQESDTTFPQDQGMESDTTSQDQGITTYPQDQEMESDTTQDSGISSDTTSQDTTSTGSGIAGEGIQEVQESELPEEVMNGLEESDFAEAQINSIFEVSGTALEQMLQSPQTTVYGDTNQQPEKIYQMHVTHEDKAAVLYFTEKGELYASDEF